MVLVTRSTMCSGVAPSRMTAPMVNSVSRIGMTQSGLMGKKMVCDLGGLYLGKQTLQTSCWLIGSAAICMASDQGCLEGHGNA